MSKLSYHDEEDLKNQKKITEELLALPNYLNDFIISIENNTSSLTRLNYLCDLKMFLGYLSNTLNKEIKQITIKEIDQITARDIERFLSYISYFEKGSKVHIYKEKGKARVLSAIRSLFKYLFNQDLILSNVVTKISTPKIHQKEIVRLDVDEVAKLLDQAEEPTNLSKRETSYNKRTKERDVAILSMFLGTGIRISECVGLNVKDINLDDNSFKITRKGGNEVVLYFSNEVKNALIEWLKVRENIEPFDKDDPALFLSLQRKRITPRAVENLVKKYTGAINPLKKVSPHKLRSTFGTNLYHETRDIYIVADVLGHKDVNTTKKHYAAITDDIRRSASTIVKLR
ncbi:MAG: tyrosine-type recombinase/integrase [Clostridia bacterium]|nr:tyrosine-type recombinase/integrase [Clostridia bacterium]